MAGVGIGSLFAIALFFAGAFHKKMEQTLAPSAFAVIAILYCAGLAGSLFAGLICVYCFAGLGLIYAVVMMMRNRMSLREQVFTPGFIVFGVLLTICILLSIIRVVSQWDALTHWALVVKNMYFCDAFGNIAGAGSAFAEYPPAIGLFEYFIVRAMPSFSEPAVYIAHNLLILTLVTPVFARLRRGNIAAMLLLGLIALLLPLTCNTETYTNLYIDSTLGLLLAYNLYSYTATREPDAFSGICFTGGVLTLVLSKSTGGGFACMALAVLAIGAIADGRKGWRAWIILLCAISAFALGKLSWAAYLIAHIDHTMWNIPARLTVQNLLGIFQSPAGWQRETIALFLRNISGHGSIRALGISYLLWPLLLLAAAKLLPSRWKDSFDERRVRVLFIALAIGIMLYAVSLLLSYLLVFSVEEAVVNASFERYMSSMMLGVIGTAVFLGTNRLQDKYEGISPAGRNRILFAMLAALLLISPLHLLDLRYFGTAEGRALRAQYAASESIGQIAGDSDQPVCYISVTDENRNDFCIARYNAAPTKLVMGVYTYGMPPAALSQSLQGRFDYIYLDRIDDAFLQRYASLFAPGTKAEAHTLYRLALDGDGGVRFVRVEE